MVSAALLLTGTLQAQVPIEAPPVAPTYQTVERLGGSFGLGGSMGTPTGLNGRLWFSDEAAIQFSFGGNLGVRNSLSAGFDYIVGMGRFAEAEGHYFVRTYAGAGVGLDAFVDGDLTTMSFGPRGVVGASLTVPTLPIDVFVQVNPTIYLVDRFGWSMGGQMGAHYYF